jgi:hypothetical protein
MKWYKTKKKKPKLYTLVIGSNFEDSKRFVVGYGHRSEVLIYNQFGFLHPLTREYMKPKRWATFENYMEK